MSAYKSYFGLDNGGKPDYFRENVYASLRYTYQRFYDEVIQTLNKPANPHINGLWSWYYNDLYYYIDHTKMSTHLGHYSDYDPNHSVFQWQSYDKFDDYGAEFRSHVNSAAYRWVNLIRQRDWVLGTYELVKSISEIEDGDLLYVMPKHELLVYPLQMVRVLDARFYWILGHIQNEPWNQIQFTEKDIPRIMKMKREFRMIGEICDN